MHVPMHAQQGTAKNIPHHSPGRPNYPPARATSSRQVHSTCSLACCSATEAADILLAGCWPAACPCLACCCCWCCMRRVREVTAAATWASEEGGKYTCSRGIRCSRNAIWNAYADSQVRGSRHLKPPAVTAYSNCHHWISVTAFCCVCTLHTPCSMRPPTHLQGHLLGPVQRHC
jgi:hypothetical protein